ESGDIELRMSAIRVASEVGVDSRQAIHSLARSLREDYEPLRVLALKALARLGAQDVADLVIPMILEPGSVGENALQVVTAVGTSVIGKVTALYPRADFHGRRAIATALSRIGGRGAIEFLLKVLPREPFELQKHITRSICDSLDAMTPAAQASLYRPV